MSDPSILKLPELIRQFFCQRLCAERHLSSATVASYRDSFCLLLEFAAKQTGRSALVERIAARHLASERAWLTGARRNSSRRTMGR
jgi:site-specific recombinase XerD